jgi:hypothetical protein
MEATRFSETSTDFQRTSRRYMAEERIFNGDFCGYFKSKLHKDVNAYSKEFLFKHAVLLFFIIDIFKTIKALFNSIV